MRALVLCALVSACGGTTAPSDAGADAGPDAFVPPMRDAGTDAGEPPLVPDVLCPGGPSCRDEGDGALRAGAAAVTITPVLDRYETEWVDANGNAEYALREGDTFVDRDGDRVFDGIWIAGFGNARAASGVHDDQWARVIVLQQNETMIAFVSLDVVGWFGDDNEPIRDMVADLGIDFVSVSATHVHEAFDTIGIWGPTLSETGRDPAYIAYVQERAAQAIRDAVSTLRPAHVQYTQLRLRDQPGGTIRYVSDTRDPQIIDDQVRVLRLLEAAGGATIATLVNFAAHPEYMGSDNTLLSSDYVHFLRDGIENGADGPDGAREDGVGGVAVFVNGALGSQIGPGGVRLQTWEGTSVSRGTLEAAQTMGSQVAYFVLRALGPDGGSITEEVADLAVRSHRFYVPIENRRYHIAYLNGLFTRALYNYDPNRSIRASNLPDVLTEIAVIDVGRAQMITAPGELDPALFVGGYDGSHTPDGVAIVDTSAENPPDLTMAPPGPYLRELARAGASQVWLLGLTCDFLGYFIPPFDYELATGLEYIVEAPGDHYEETNSIGEHGWPRIGAKIEELLAYPAP